MSKPHCDCCHDLEPVIQHLKRLVESADRLVARVEIAEQFYKEELEAIGGCDHPVNICCCGIINDAMDLMTARKDYQALRGKEQGK